MQEKNEEISFLSQNGGQKFAYVKILLYICTEFGNGNLNR